MSAAAGAGRTSRSQQLGAGLALLGLAAVTRIPLAGRSLGEADCARYLVGMEQWLRSGPQAPYIYAKVLSPGYYAAAAWWVRQSGVAPAHLLNIISVVAALLSAPLLYFVGCRLTSHAVAMAGTVLFLLSPAYWWLGIEPHPQGASFFCFLLALACFLGVREAETPTREWRLAAGVAAAVWMGAGLLLKCDLVLLGGIFPALRWREMQARSVIPHGRAAMAELAGSLLIPAGGLGIFLVGQRLLLPLGWGQSHHQTQSAVLEFLSLPHGVAAFKQVLPMLTAPGLATLAMTALGVGLGLMGRGDGSWRRRWLWPLGAWVVPGVVFWALMRGNNARHMAPYLLLPLWAGIEALDGMVHAWRAGTALRRGWSLAALCLVVIGVNWVVVPASSNVSLYPSGNVPASQRDLAARSAEMEEWMHAQLRSAQARGDTQPCFLGNYTLPYIELALLRAAPAGYLTPLDAPASRFAAWPNNALQLTWLRAQASPPPRRRINARFIEVNNSAEYAAAAAGCEQTASGAEAWSLEYDSAGMHQRFMGEEWRTLPLARRWFPGGAVNSN